LIPLGLLVGVLITGKGKKGSEKNFGGRLEILQFPHGNNDIGGTPYSTLL